MKFSQLNLSASPGLSIPINDRYRQVLRMAEYANDKGFVGVWLTEHHFSDYSLIPNPLMLLSKIASVAPDVRIGTAIVILPLWHPVRLAEDIAMLDVLSGGRVDVGIGRGFASPEFEGLGIDIGSNREMFDETIDIAFECWTKTEFEHHGKFWNFGPISVLPKPSQQPHPPIWMAATTPPSIRNAVRRGYHLCIGTGPEADELQIWNAFIDSLLGESGSSTHTQERAVTRLVFCSTSSSERDSAVEAARWQIGSARALSAGIRPVKGHNDPGPERQGLPSAEIFQRRMIIGDPNECVRRCQELADSGISYVFGIFDYGALDHNVAMRSMKLFGEEVLPAVTEMKRAQLDAEMRDKALARFMSEGLKSHGF